MNLELAALKSGMYDDNSKKANIKILEEKVNAMSAACNSVTSRVISQRI